jgi:homocysteine S-methyltransferase
LNLSAPQLVKEVHEAYVKAGAQIIEANTFGANRGRLSTFSLGEKLAAINEAGVRLAREAAGEAAFVAGSVGPSGLRNAAPEQLREIFGEQAAVLVGAGVDLLVLETFFSIDELREAVTAVRAAAGPELAIIAQVTINDDGAMLDGTSTEDFTALLDQWPVDVIGLDRLGRPQGHARNGGADHAADSPGPRPCPTPDIRPMSKDGRSISVRPSICRSTPAASFGPG